MLAISQMRMLVSTLGGLLSVILTLPYLILWPLETVTGIDFFTNKWVVSYDTCFRSDSYRCINENPDPGCSYPTPWCPNAKPVARRLLDDKAKNSSMSPSGQSFGTKKFMKQNLQELRKKFIKVRREFQKSKVKLGVNQRSMGARIIGGDDIYRGAFPWMARIVRNNQTICSGSLLNKNAILTAANCLVDNDFDLGNMHVVLGEFSLRRHERGKVRRKILRTCAHPGYEPPSALPIRTTYGKNDIAVIWLDKEVQYNKFIQPICHYLSEHSKPQTRGNCVGIGYGAIRAENEVNTRRPVGALSDRLRMVGLDQVDCPVHYQVDRTVACYRPWKIYSTTERTTLRPGACYGDFGGSLACFDPVDEVWYLHGVLTGMNTNCGSKAGFDFIADAWELRNDINNMLTLSSNNTQICWEFDAYNPRPTTPRPLFSLGEDYRRELEKTLEPWTDYGFENFEE